MDSTPEHKSAEAYLEAYLRELRAVGNRSVYTIRNYRNDIGHFYRWMRAAERDPLTTNRQEFRTYLGELRGRGMVAASVTRRTSTVHGFYKYLLQEAATAKDLLYGIGLPKKPKTLPKVLDPNVVAALLAAPDSDTLQGVCSRVLSSTPLPPSHANSSIPSPFDEIIAACMTKDPAKRIASGDALATSLYPYARRKTTAEVSTQSTSLRDRASRLLRSA